MKIGFVEQCFEKLAVEYLMAICERAGAEIELFLDPTLFADAFYENNLLGRVFDISDRLADRIAASAGVWRTAPRVIGRTRHCRGNGSVLFSDRLVKLRHHRLHNHYIRVSVCEQDNPLVLYLSRQIYVETSR